LKNFKWVKRKIKIGYLEGNRFRIVVRDLDKKDAIKISNKIRGLDWFPNYFGPQRFGSLRGNNVKIGKLILKRKFEDAVWAILTDIGAKESSDVRFAREKLSKEKNFISAAGYFPNYLKLEKGTLNYLSRNPGDFVGAIKKAERKNMLMFVHSVQSKIFNEILEIALSEGIDFTKKGLESCILAGYKTRFYDGRLGEIEREVLENHGLQLNDFDVGEIPYLRIKGSFRKAVVKVDGLEISVEDDEIFPSSRKIVLNFTLPSGVYATTFLEKFFEFE
jgi:tRNA pseudouridine13 synthase